MIDRENVLAILRRGFPTASPDQLTAVANAIVDLDDEWSEIPVDSDLLDYIVVRCPDICPLADRLKPGDEVRVFRKGPPG